MFHVGYMCGSQVVKIWMTFGRNLEKEIKLFCGVKSDSASCHKRGRVADNEEDIVQPATTKKSKEMKEDKLS